MKKGKVVVLEERVPKLKEQRRQRANRLLIGYIALFFMLILCIIYFQSPLSNVSKIEVRGNKHLTDRQIVQLSGLTKETSLWKVKNEDIEKKISKHPEIKEVRVQKRFPNKMVITVAERKRIAYVLDKQKFLPILENGQVLTATKEPIIPSDAPILIGWKKGEEIQEMAAQLAKLPDSILNLISEIHHTPRSSDRFHITVYMNDGLEVSATVRNFAEKIALYPSIVSHLDPNRKGVLHLEMSTYFEPYKSAEQGDDSDESKR
jgi:cell division protein FtsQ